MHTKRYERNIENSPIINMYLFQYPGNISSKFDRNSGALSSEFLYFEEIFIYYYYYMQYVADSNLKLQYNVRPISKRLVIICVDVIVYNSICSQSINCYQYPRSFFQDCLKILKKML